MSSIAIVFLVLFICSLIIISITLFFIFRLKNKNKILINKKTQDFKNYLKDEDIKEINNYFDNYFKQEQLNKLEEIKQIREEKVFEIIESLNFYNEWRNKVVSTIFPENTEMISRLIGKDGVNKKYLENELNVLINFNKLNNSISISSHSMYRKELTKKVIEKLLNCSTIDKNRITKVISEIQEQFKKEIANVGFEAFKQLNVDLKIDEKIYYYIGMLQYRTSFQQNILSHSLEVSQIAYKLAKLFEVDANKAKVCAFFHDIGKSIDLVDSNGLDHVDQGINIAKECFLDQDIVHCIKSHHYHETPKTIYAAITILADKISSSFPLARINSEELINIKSEKLEMICNSIEGVKKSYAVKSANELRVIIDYKQGDLKENIDIITQKIKEKIKNEYQDIENLDIILICNYESKIKI